MTWEGGRRALSAALLILALLLGGGHSAAHALLLELLALLLLAVALIEPGVPGGRMAIPALVLVALVAALPLLHLIPLPAALWTALPGRAPATDVTMAAGLTGLARPLSLDPDATREAAFMLLPPIAMFVAALRSTATERARLLLIVAVGAAASLAVGIAQHPLGLDLYLYAGYQHRFPIGLFANHNQQADLLLVGMTCLAPLAFARTANPAGGLAAGAGFFALAIGVLATASRTGMALLVIPFAVAAAQWLGGNVRRRLPGIVLAAVLIGGAGYIALSHNNVAQRSVARFDQAAEARPLFWRTTSTAIDATFPTGSGIGTFVPTYQLYERPEDMGHFYVNHAHNDYLEIILEGGLPALLLLLAYLLLIGRRIAGGLAQPQRQVALGGIAILLAHSIVDYPLRMTSLAVIFALFNAILIMTPETAPSAGRRRKRPNSAQPRHGELLPGES